MSAEKKPTFLTQKEWACIQALVKYKDWSTSLQRSTVADELGIHPREVAKKIGHIRKKVESAYAFNRKYKKIIERKY